MTGFVKRQQIFHRFGYPFRYILFAQIVAFYMFADAEKVFVVLHLGRIRFVVRRCGSRRIRFPRRATYRMRRIFRYRNHPASGCIRAAQSAIRRLCSSASPS